MANVMVAPEPKKVWFENFARYGLVSKGIVYCMMGVLTLLAAVGLGGKKASKTEAFEVIYRQPFGKILLVCIIIGLLGFVTLRVFQCFKDIDNKGKNLKGIITRIGFGLSALIYAGLGIFATKLFLYGSQPNGDSKQFIVSKVLEYPAGQWIVTIAALIVIGSGINQIYKAVAGKFMNNVYFLHSKTSNLFKKVGVLGYSSRGVVLIILGYFLLRAALASNPKAVKDTTDAFHFLENNFGTFLMGLAALGLIGYGVFMFVKAKYQRIQM
jgi:hypothetical protein